MDVQRNRTCPNHWWQTLAQKVFQSVTLHGFIDSWITANRFSCSSLSLFMRHTHHDHVICVVRAHRSKGDDKRVALGCHPAVKKNMGHGSRRNVTSASLHMLDGSPDAMPPLLYHPTWAYRFIPDNLSRARAT